MHASPTVKIKKKTRAIHFDARYVVIRHTNLCTLSKQEYPNCGGGSQSVTNVTPSGSAGERDDKSEDDLKIYKLFSVFVCHPFFPFDKKGRVNVTREDSSAG